MCYKGTARQRTIEVNHQNNAYRAEARKLLKSEKGLHHRSMRPIEPEAVFGDIKYNHGFKRFKLKSNAKVSVEFWLVGSKLSRSNDADDDGRGRSERSERSPLRGNCRRCGAWRTKKKRPTHFGRPLFLDRISRRPGYSPM